MIVERLFAIIVGAVTALFNLLPTEPSPPDLGAMFEAAFGGYRWVYAALSDWFPLDELGTALVGLIGFMLLIHVVRLVAWVLALVHIGGTDA